VFKEQKMYSCDTCDYLTNRVFNLKLHQQKKKPCKNISDIIPQNVKKITQNVKKITQNVKILKDEVCVDLQCNNCKKIFKDKYKLQIHGDRCKGHEPIICSLCHGEFKSRQAKYYHQKNVNCSPPETGQQPSVIINNHNVINNNNITTNITNQNIQINVFGKEDLSYLIHDKCILEKLKGFGKSGLYGLPKIIGDVHFNKNRPENLTLIKPDEYGSGVMIMNDDNEWEYREFEDIRGNLIDTLMKYFKAYNTVKNVLGVKLSEMKERKIIKNCAYELMALDGSVPADLFEELEMNDGDIEDNEDEIKNKWRKFDKSTMKNIHQNTSKIFKKENGCYINK
jgi:hypothetical protein